MNLYQLLTILVSLLAIVVSVVSLVRTRKIHEKQLEFQKIAADLSAKQMQILEREEAARISVRLAFTPSEGYSFVISNDGKAVARNIHFSLNGRSGYNPLNPDEYAQKIPIPSLHPGHSVSLSATGHVEFPMQHGILVRWTNPDGKQVTDEVFTSL